MADCFTRECSFLLKVAIVDDHIVAKAVVAIDRFTTAVVIRMQEGSIL